MESKEFADDLLDGNIWLTTLYEMRKNETDGRGDVGEGTERRTLPFLITGSDESEQGANPLAKEVGIRIERSPGGVVENCSMTTDVDCFILCATELYDPQSMTGNFGGYCVKISNPFEFAKLISIELKKLFFITREAYGRVRYTGRETIAGEDNAKHSGFLKPVDGYSEQQEIRTLWEIGRKEGELKPFKLHCPEAGKLCTIVRTS